MSLDRPAWPASDLSTRWVRWLTVVACLTTIGAVTLIVGLKVLGTADGPVTDEHDYDFTGDPAVLQVLDVPPGLHEVTDRPGCAAREPNVRCFTTLMNRGAVVAYLHSTVGAAAHDNHDGNLKPGWTACGDLLGTPAVATISRDPTNAIHTGPGSWKFPRSGLTYGDRLVVSMTLFNDPDCA
jgi:hypothetical protein